MLILFFPTLTTDIQLIKNTFNKIFLLEFILPMILVIITYIIFPNLKRSRLAVFEHEFTHMIAAIISLNSPKAMGFRRDNVFFQHNGPRNWFIDLAPYIWPMYISLVICTQIILQAINPLIYQDTTDIFTPLLGALLGHRIVYNIYQIHPNQSDFAHAGHWFSTILLPTANLLVFGAIWAFVANGLLGITQWMNALSQETHFFFQQLF
jgi:hypothetical protein